VDLSPGVRVHVRLVLRVQKAALFVGEIPKPSLVVPRLARSPRAGYLARRGFVPQDTRRGSTFRFGWGTTSFSWS